MIARVITHRKGGIDSQGRQIKQTKLDNKGNMAYVLSQNRQGKQINLDYMECVAHIMRYRQSEKTGQEG